MKDSLSSTKYPIKGPANSMNSITGRKKLILRSTEV